MSAKRTTQFVFEEIGGENSTKVLFIVCTDGTRSLANLDDIAKLKAEGAERVVRAIENVAACKDCVEHQLRCLDAARLAAKGK